MKLKLYQTGLIITCLFYSSFIGAQSPYNSNQLLIRFNPNSSVNKQNAFLSQINGSISETEPETQIHLVTITFPVQLPGEEPTSNIINVLKHAHSVPDVDETGLNYEILNTPMTLEDVLNYLGHSNYTPNIYCSESGNDFECTSGFDPVKVGILDTGVDLNGHGQLLSPFITNSENFLDPGASGDDDHGHGTKVAGIISATVAGTVGQNLRLYSLKTLDQNGQGDLFTAIKALGYCIRNSVHIINLSWGYEPSPNDPYTQILEYVLGYASDKDILTFAAAGNSQYDLNQKEYYPAGFSNVAGLLSVAALDCEFNLASYSNFGSKIVDLVLPGESILCPTLNGMWTASTGTSFATPIAGAIATQLISSGKAKTVEEVVCFFKSGADPHGFQSQIHLGSVETASQVCDATGCNTSNLAPFSNPNIQFEHKTKITAYPSPVLQELNVAISHAEEVQANIQLLNLQGQVIYAEKVVLFSGESRLQIPGVAQLPSGIYYLNVEIKGERFPSKIVKH